VGRPATPASGRSPAGQRPRNETSRPVRARSPPRECRASLELDLARFYLREIENVVDDGQQRFAGPADDLDILDLLTGERRVEQQGRHADDAVHRRADLMAHVREELRFGARGLLELLVQRYFEKKDDRWQLKEEVRRMVEFLEMNLVEPWPAMPTMDIIFMRNVLIYVGVDMKKAVLTKVRRLLKPDGVLLLGGSESTLYLDESFEPFPAERPALFRVRA
jgi:SAM-dependent methyltransferase